MRKGKTSLLIGATGFIGHQLAHYLLQNNERVIGTYHNQSHKPKFDSRIRLIRCDVTEPQQIAKAVRSAAPDFIYYLAAQSSVRIAWQEPVKTLQINFLGGVYLLETLRQIKSTSRILIFSSATAYGSSHNGIKLNEETCLRPKDPYSLSKAGIDYFARLYANVHDLDISVVRLGNLTGPGQSTEFSIASFASQIVKIEKGRQAAYINVGNLNARRDFLDVRDGLRAIYLVMKKGRKGEVYNIASGKTLPLKEVLSLLIGMSGNAKKIQIRRKNHLIPKDSILSMALDPAKLVRLTGWKPKIPLRQTLGDVLYEWRNKIR